MSSSTSTSAIDDCVINVMAFLEKDKNIKIHKGWLEACIEWILEEEEAVESNMYQLVFNQLLHSNLSEVITRGCFYGINLSQFGELEGNFLVQVNSMIDVSCSVYSKLLKLKNGRRENILEETDKRLMLLNITDGEKEIKALEYQTISVFDSHIVPGSKILLQGKMKYNLNLILLSCENVNYLGGCVSCLIESNKMENILNVELYGTNWDHDELRKERMREVEIPETVRSCNSLSMLHQTIVIDGFHQLDSMNLRAVHLCFVVKSHVCRIVDKISYISGLWVLTVLIQDTAGSKLEVRLSDQILKELIGFSARYFTNKMVPNKSDSGVRKKANKGFTFCQSFISDLNCYMMIRSDHIDKHPVIVKLLDM